MKFAAAYMMAIMAGKEPSRENLEEMLNAVGIEWTSQGDELLKQHGRQGDRRDLGDGSGEACHCITEAPTTDLSTKIAQPTQAECTTPTRDSRSAPSCRIIKHPINPY